MSVEKVLGHVEKQLELIEEALAGLSAITAVYASPDGLVVTEADASGALVGLWLDETVCQLPGDDVGRLIVRAAAEASALAGAHRDHVFSALTSAVATLASRSLR
ncbi:MAG: YbaB/EbfC family DNA-binding protein [Nocardiaceae bacterium]|nr:YbaB/EbfC family DNA-binding protein [Nocardiaceae bacterium]